MDAVKSFHKMVGDAMSELQTREETLETRRKQLAEEEAVLAQKYPIAGPIVDLNVSGVHFTTRLATLRLVPGSMLEAMFSGRHELARDRDGRIFIDRPSAPFRWILTVLQTTDVSRGFVLPPGLSPAKRKLLVCELDYYGLSLCGPELLKEFSKRSPSANMGSPAAESRIQSATGNWTGGVISVPLDASNRDLQWSIRILAAGNVAAHIFMGVVKASHTYVTNPTDGLSHANFLDQLFGLYNGGFAGTAISSASGALPCQVNDTVHFRMSPTQLRICLSRNLADVRTFTFADTAFVPVVFIVNSTLELIEPNTDPFD
eukprot:gnl/Spiro4/25837_TR12863_c0_g1_i1.p1 gnl/Spiro4/25837_TR12863_c0_g1~~gnl/Spiro4/25837_TR12863_c0_g1_i1.p1  ORF type:complete len:326 (-),score=83.55 gnl/Spiro4/25837_TR12863_c0_g1_i1:95-1045(-)